MQTSEPDSAARAAHIVFVLVVLVTGCSSNPRPYGGIRPSFSPDGIKLVYGAGSDAGHGDLFIANLITGKAEQLTKSSECERQPSFSPDGTQIAYISSAKGRDYSQVYLLELRNRTKRALTHGPYADGLPSFSPDGKRVLFARAYTLRDYSMGGHMWNDVDLCTIGIDGKNETRLTNKRFYGINSPYFSPDGKRIVFGVNDIALNIFMLDLRRDTLMKLRPDSDMCFDPTFTPDGQTILYIADPQRSHNQEIWKMRSDGTNPVQLTRTGSYNVDPIVSPDGKRIFFLSDKNRSFRYSLWSIDMDGNNLHQVFDQKMFHLAPER